MSRSIAAAQLKAIAGGKPRADLVSAIVRGWPAAVEKAKLTTHLRAAHFLAQIMTETGGLQILEESGAYRAPRIMAIFGVGHHSAKITDAEAKRIAALPVAQRGPVLFNRVYGVGNPTKMREFSNTGPNDGWLYRGGGMMQATGKSNYAKMEKKTGLPLVAHPEMLHQPDSAFMAAYLEWAQDGRCNAAADRDDVVVVRRIINGGSNGLAECRAFLAKAKKALADYSVEPVAALFVEPEPESESEKGGADAATAPAEPVPVPVLDAVPVAGDVDGDPELFSVKKRLRAMNYNPGVQNGVWGGMTAGAIAGFINDRSGLDMLAPTSLEKFNDIRDELKAELSKAEGEHFVRPVTPERAHAEPAVLAEVAPESVPVKRGRLKTIAAGISALFFGFIDAIKGYTLDAWNFFTDHKDDLPSDSGLLQTAWGYVTGVPSVVWWLLAGCGLLYIALDLNKADKVITESVSTGARQ